MDPYLSSVCSRGDFFRVDELGDLDEFARQRAAVVQAIQPPPAPKAAAAAPAAPGWRARLQQTWAALTGKRPA